MFIKVEAMDADEGKNGAVHYSIISTKPKSASNIFVIESETGYISTSDEIDRELFDRYQNLV